MYRSLLLLAVLCAKARSQSSATLEELIQQTLARSKDIASARQRVAEAKGVLRQSGARPALVVEASGASGRPLRSQGEHSYSATVSRQMETWGKRNKRVRVAEYGVALAEAELGEKISALRRDLRIACANESAARRKTGVLGELAQLLDDTLQLTEARVNEGDAARLDADLVRVELSRVKALHLAAEGQAEAARLELRRLAGLETEARLELADAAEKPGLLDVAALRQLALAQRPDLAAARMIERQYAAGVELAEAEAKPDVTVSAGYSHVTSRFDEQFGLSPSGALSPLRDADNALSVGFSIPITGRARNLGNIEAAAARAASARLKREFLERSIPAELDAAISRYSALQRSVTLLRDGVLNPSEKNLEIIRQAYALGQLRLIDVLNEQRRLLETRLSHIDSEADLNRALADIEFAAGGALR